MLVTSVGDPRPVNHVMLVTQVSDLGHVSGPWSGSDPGMVTPGQSSDPRSGQTMLVTHTVATFQGHSIYKVQ